jgi:hypothetical protein
MSHRYVIENVFIYFLTTEVSGFAAVDIIAQMTSTNGLWIHRKAKMRGLHLIRDKQSPSPAGCLRGRVKLRYRLAMMARALPQ